MTIEFNITHIAARVLYEDNHLLVVNKPAGLLVQGDAGGGPNLLDLGKAYIKDRYEKPGRAFLGLVHRLDKPVGGVVVLARTSKSAARLSEQFRRRQVDKIYWAVVSGRPTPPEGEHAMHLARRGHTSDPASPDDPGARPAGLKYRTLDAGPLTSLIEVRLLTGRRHQIRAQFSHLGHPIAGDRKYGSTIQAQPDSIGLFARRLAFRHPTRGEIMTFEAAPDHDWPWLPLI